jgi:hypothetical protein
VTRHRYALAYLAGVALMAVIIGLISGPVQRTVEAQPTGQRWECSLDAFSTLARCASAPSDGTTIYITDIIGQSNGLLGGVWSLQAGTGVNCATGTVAVLPSSAATNRFWFPCSGAAGGELCQTIPISLRTPIRVPKDKDLCAAAAVASTIQLYGYLAP